MSVADKYTTLTTDKIPKVFSAGKQKQYDEFWDAYQDYGNRPQYTQAFRSWYDGCYRPKYPIICQKNWSTIEIFRYATIVDTRVDIEFKGNNDASRLFYDCTALVTVRKIKLDKTVNVDNSFRACNSLENITFEGEIGCNVDFHWSPFLTVESLRSILTALYNYSGTDKAFTCTLTLHADSKTILENEGATSPNGNTWLEYANDKGWSVL